MDPEQYKRLKEIDNRLKQVATLDEARIQDYEDFLEAFPGSHEHWIKYINEELNSGDTDAGTTDGTGTAKGRG